MKTRDSNIRYDHDVNMDILENKYPCLYPS